MPIVDIFSIFNRKESDIKRAFREGVEHGRELGKKDALADIAIKNGGVDPATEEKVNRFLADNGVVLTYYPDGGGLVLTKARRNIYV